MDDSNCSHQPSSGSTSPAGQISSAMPGHSKQHLFSSFSPSYNFLDAGYMDTSDGNASDLSQVTSMDSEIEVITGVRDMVIEPKSSRFTWLEPQDSSEHTGSPLAPQLPLGSLIEPGLSGNKDSPNLEPQQTRSQTNNVPETPPRFELLYPGANYSNVFGFGQASPSETPPRSWSREPSENLVDARRWASSKSSPRLARSLFTPPFTPRSYNKSNLNEDAPSPLSTTSIQGYLLDSIATSIQGDVDFPLNDLQESLKSVTINEDHTSRQQQLLKPTRIIVLEGVDEDLAFDEIRAALMAHGEIRHLSVDYLTTCLCVYYNLGAAVNAYTHIRKNGLAHQHRVDISFGDQIGLRKFGPVPEEILVNQGALIVWNHTGLNLSEVMTKFGDIKSLEEHELCPAEASVVEFNDVRCAKRALEYIQEHHRDSLFVEFKNPMRKTWNPPTRDVALPSSAHNKPSYFSPTLRDWDIDPLFSLSPHVGKERHVALQVDSDDNNYHSGMLLESPERHDTFSNMETPRRMSRPKVPSIVTTFGLGDSPVSQRQQHLQQLQHENGRGIDSPLYVGPSPINFGGITNMQPVASPTSYINGRASYSAAGLSHSDLMTHSESVPIDMYGRKRMNHNNFSNIFGPSNNNNNNGRTRLFSSSLGEYASSPLSSSPLGMMAINDSVWGYSNSHNQPFMTSKLQHLQGSLSTPLSAPAVSSPVWRHSGHDSLISPLMASPLHGGNLGSSPLVTTGNIMSSGHILKNGDFELARVVAGLDNRTTFMIKNLPNKYTQQMLIEFLNETHRGEYDFLYVRIDFINRCNVGYAFINFANPASVISFAERVVGKRWPRFNSTKVCTLSYAKIQGLDALIRKFRDSSVMLEEPAFRPKIFFTSGPNKGDEAPFPSPTISLRPSSRGLYSKTHGYIHGTDGIGSMDSPTALNFSGILSKPSHARHSSTTSISTEMTVQSNNSNHDNINNVMVEVDNLLGSGVANSSSVSSLVILSDAN